MSAEEFGGLVRTLAAFAGGFFVSKGLVDNATMMSIAAAVGTIGVAGWSIWSKKKAAA